MTAATYDDGTAAGSDDPIIGTTLTSPPADPRGGKLVDLDPDQQLRHRKLLFRSSRGGALREAVAGWNHAKPLPANEPALFGKPAIRSRTANSAETYDDELTSTVEDLQIRPDLAVARVSYAESWIPKAGGAMTSVAGKSVFVFRRQADGSWKIGTLIWNFDAPVEQ